jgi:SagB-type dehydrogenase family enzyme
MASDSRTTVIRLPEPRYRGDITLETALFKRRSIREYKHHVLTISELSQLLWAAQGINDKKNKYRTAPSAGALYPLEIYILNGNIKGMDKGIYKFRPISHDLIRTAMQAEMRKLSEAALYQEWMVNASMILVITADYQRTMKWYGQRGRQYVLMEAGHAAQNIHLQSVALDLGTVVIGAFDDDLVSGCLDLPENEEPLCIMPIGKF